MRKILIVLLLVLCNSGFSGIPTSFDPMGTIGMFTPKSILNLKLWLDASDVQSMVISGTNVISWADKSSNGLYATNIVTFAPVLISSFTKGKNALNFNGSNQRLFLNETLTISNTTIFVVFDRTSSGIKNMILGKSDDKCCPFEWYSDNAVYVVFSGGVRYTSGQGGTGVFVDSLSSTNSLIDSVLYRRNRASFTLTSKTAYSALNIINTIGYGDLNYNNGAIMEIVFYDRKLSDSEIVIIENYLWTKWK